MKIYQFSKRYDHFSAIKRQYKFETCLFKMEKMFDGHLGCHIVLGVMPKDDSLVSIGFYINPRFTIYRFSAAIMDLAAILNFFTVIMARHNKLSCLLNIKCHPFKKSTNCPCFWRPSWTMAAILNCPRMPDWHQSDFKSE